MTYDSNKRSEIFATAWQTVRAMHLINPTFSFREALRRAWRMAKYEAQKALDERATKAAIDADNLARHRAATVHSCSTLADAIQSEMGRAQFAEMSSNDYSKIKTIHSDVARRIAAWTQGMAA